MLALAREGYRWRDVSAEQLSRLARPAAFRNAPSPAAMASLAIAEQIVARLSGG